MFANLYAGKRVFITGHTGFKGSWLAEWLLRLGAHVTGYSDAVNEGRDHFTALGLDKRLDHVIGDVCDRAALAVAIRTAKPDFVFHLAAQSLVRESYREPVKTFATNVLGTANVLDVLRDADQPVSCVIVTSDKCYQNNEVLAGYRENDALGGSDPYSASKAAAEIVTHSYRRSFFSDPASVVKLASARAGNVIGGGDWSQDRIVPDCIRHLLGGEVIAVRNPAATRPWQHVLEPLSGYLWLGAMLTGKVHLPRATSPEAVSQAFNFGPWPEANRDVKSLVEELLVHWPGTWRHASAERPVHEAGLLSVTIDKAYHVLQWQPVYSFAENVAATARWYHRVARQQACAVDETRADIKAYEDAARLEQVTWARHGLIPRT